MTTLLVDMGTSGNTWPCCTLSPCCLHWDEKVEKPRNLAEPQVAPVPAHVKGWGRGEGGERNHAVLHCKGVECRLPFILVWGFFCLFGFCFCLVFLLRAVRYWMGYYVAELLLNHSNANDYLIICVSNVVRWRWSSLLLLWRFAWPPLRGRAQTLCSGKVTASWPGWCFVGEARERTCSRFTRCHSFFCYLCRRQLSIPDVWRVCGSTCNGIYFSGCSLYCVQLQVRDYSALMHILATVQNLECK